MIVLIRRDRNTKIMESKTMISGFARVLIKRGQVNDLKLRNLFTTKATQWRDKSCLHHENCL